MYSKKNIWFSFDCRSASASTRKAKRIKFTCIFEWAQREFFADIDDLKKLRFFFFFNYATKANQLFIFDFYSYANAMKDNRKFCHWNYYVRLWLWMWRRNATQNNSNFVFDKCRKNFRSKCYFFSSEFSHCPSVSRTISLFIFIITIDIWTRIVSATTDE